MSLIERGLNLKTAAASVGVHATTLLRWRHRSALGEPLAARRGPEPRSVDAQTRQRAEDLVRELHGLIGADALAHRISGLSRRAAGEIKTEVCTSLERERKHHSQHVVITVPGVVRGFDAMHIRPGIHWLVAADGAVPYRTSLERVPRYDAKAVAAFLEADLRRSGEPLVLRLDRAKQHATREVQDVLERYGVMVLHGPPRRPSYYGQLERQNREHRAWLRTSTDNPTVTDTHQAMLSAFNASWPRRTLGWKTAEELWNARPPIRVDRAAFRKDVNQRAQRIRKKLDMKGKPKDLAERLAIEQALQARGLLRRDKGRGC
jgi:transposase InsO family protein